MITKIIIAICLFIGVMWFAVSKIKEAQHRGEYNLAGYKEEPMDDWKTGVK